MWQKIAGWIPDFRSQGFKPNARNGLGVAALFFSTVLGVCSLSGCFRIPVSIQFKREGDKIKLEPQELWVRSSFTVELKIASSLGPGNQSRHVLMVVKPDTEKEVMALAAAAGEAKDFTPESGQILAKSKLLKEGESETIRFVAPAIGLYPILCSVPGHEGERAVLRVSER